MSVNVLITPALRPQLRGPTYLESVNRLLLSPQQNHNGNRACPHRRRPGRAGVPRRHLDVFCLACPEPSAQAPCLGEEREGLTPHESRLMSTW